MDIEDQLSTTLLKQDFVRKGSLASEDLERCRLLARGYADVENALVVLSDLYAGESHIYYGGFVRTLGISTASDGQRIRSIWEEDILKRIHPDDLYGKYLLELRFFHFVKHLPRHKRADYYLIEKLRMRDAHGNYLSVLHRMFYIMNPSDGCIRLALCLYSPLISDIPAGGCVIHSVTGQMTVLEKCHDSRILSEREKQVLCLIDRGMTSKHIAGTLAISVNTVSRHRQEILQKLKVRNSIEACRIAKDLGII